MAEHTHSPEGTTHTHAGGAIPHTHVPKEEDATLEAEVAFMVDHDVAVVLVRYRKPRHWERNSAGQLNGWRLDSVWMDPDDAAKRRDHLHGREW